jgi:hypothetical protein
VWTGDSSKERRPPKYENVNTGNRHEYNLYFVPSVLQKTDTGPCRHCGLTIGSLIYHNDGDKKNMSKGKSKGKVHPITGHEDTEVD